MRTGLFAWLIRRSVVVFAAALADRSAALAGAISRVLTDEALRLQLAAAAQCRAIREDADHTARAFETLYLRLVAAGG